jgi:voltage-gated potassium channel
MRARFHFFRKIRMLFRKYDWLTIIVVFLTLHCISAALLLVFDFETYRQETILKTLWKGTWWFFVTSTTVGYGDVVPKTIPGQVIAIFDMIFGIGLMFTIIGAGTDRLIDRRRAKMRGCVQLKRKKHIVILGGGALVKLKKLVKEIRQDLGDEYRDIVLCSKVYKENPIPDEVEFVCGAIDDEDTLRRACVDKAATIIIYGLNDEETILTAMAVDEINREAFTTVYIRNRANIKHINRLNKLRVEQGSKSNGFSRIRIITRMNDLMLAREISNPDLSEALLELMDSKYGNTFYSIQAWPEMNMCIKLPEVRHMLREADAHALLVGVKHDENGQMTLNPGEDTYICPRDQLFVIADKKPKIDWSEYM